jgi:hypothetical protein
MVSLFGQEVSFFENCTRTLKIQIEIEKLKHNVFSVFSLPLRAYTVKVCDIKTGNGDKNEYRKQIDDSMAGSARQVQ